MMFSCGATGDLGFPHRGFPQALSDAILRGDAKRSVRAGVTMSPIDFTSNQMSLKEVNEQKNYTFEHVDIDECQSMCNIMYPKVHDDYLNVVVKYGQYLRYLPTPCYLYGVTAGTTTTIAPPKEYYDCNKNNKSLKVLNNIYSSSSGSSSSGSGSSGGIDITCDRVGPLKDKHRTVDFTISTTSGDTTTTTTTVKYSVTVKDASSGFEFEGKMADNANPLQLASPMPGLVDKLSVAVGDEVCAGDVVAVISAMKMEIKVTVPDFGDDDSSSSSSSSSTGKTKSKMKINELSVSVGDQLIEGALVAILGEA